MRAVDVIKEHKRLYQERQLARNPLLHFFAGRTAARIDLEGLFGAQAAVPESLSSTSRRITPVSAASLLGGLLADVDDSEDEARYVTKERRVLNLPPSLCAKVEKIRVASSDTKHATGQHACFIGFPMLVTWQPEKKAPIVAPLFLLPVHLSLNGKDLVFSRAGDVRPNVYLERWLAITHNIQISFSALLESINTGMDGSTQQKTLDLFQDGVKKALQEWRELEGKSDLNGPLMPAPTRDDAKRHQEIQAPPQLIWSALCGVAEFKGQALNADLEALEKEYTEDTATDGALRYFVRQVTLDSSDADTPSEHEKFLVCNSDPSQEKVVWQHKKTEVLVIEGPPGTGKSQTIVNMIADSLARGLRIAVFCEKRPALEVVHKRMGRLGELCCLIDDPTLQRKEVITYLRDAEDWRDSAFRTVDRAKTTAHVERFETDAERSLHPLYADSPGQYRFADLSSKERSLREVCAEVLAISARAGFLRLLKQHHSKQPTQFQQELRRYSSLAEEARSQQFSASPWRYYDSDSFDSTYWHDQLRTLAAFLLLDSSLRAQIVEHQHWLAGNALLPPVLCRAIAGSQIEEAIRAYRGAVGALSALRRALPRWEAIRTDGLLGKQSDKMLRHLEVLQSHLPRAPAVSHIRKILKESELGGFLDLHLGHAGEYWHQCVEWAWCQYQLEDMKAKHPGRFDSSMPATHAIGQLKAALAEKREADVVEIRRLFRQREGYSNTLKDNNLLRLRSAPKRGERKTELRDLYVRGHDTLMHLKPVLLARPEVACAVLPLTRGLFDLVIIDEASQMFVAEAMPLLHRAKRVVIAGDSKQMPPSAFFAINSDGGEDELEDESLGEDESEVEERLAVPAAAGQHSLLDAANELASGHGKRLLQIHYRSNFRELIEFSNQAFYEGRLQAPPGNPAARTPLERPIVFEQLSGEFKTGLNEQEAKRIVHWLSRLLVEAPECSLGVIVMNAKQKDRIEELLAEKAADDRTFANLLEAKRDQVEDDQDVGLFIRNVERVQGDERDIIIFGATYAANSNGFGPLKDPDNGRKRLNVAITRAKKGMVVLSCLNLDGERHSFDSARDGTYVRQFLRYARAVSQNDVAEVDRLLSKVNPAYAIRKRDSDEFESPFEEEVCRFLEEHGFDVETQVGVEGFRIDLAVRHPRGGYLCGLECDGAQYHSGWRARTNDIWRQQILEAKGWRIERIWSTDWFNSAVETKRLLLEKLLTLIKDCSLAFEHNDTDPIGPQTDSQKPYVSTAPSTEPPPTTSSNES